MKKLSLFKSVGFSAICAAMLVGCGGGSSSASDGASGDGGVVTNPYEGSKSISGSFETFGSTTQEGSKAVKFSAAGDEIVKLYVMGEDGELKDTNLTCDITGDGSYSCDNIAENKEYIVRYMKEVSGGRVLEMKSNVTVADTDVTGATVNRVTTLIVEAVSKAVEEAILGVELTEDKIKELVASVKDAVKTSITSLVSQGLIEIPSEDDLIVEANFDDFKSKTEKNEKLKDSSSTILTADAVTSRMSASKSEAKLSNYADMTKKELVREIFAQTQDKGDVPTWIVEFLGDKYNDVPADYTFSSFISQLLFESDIGDTEQLRRIGLTESDINDLIIDANDNLHESGFTKLKEEIEAHYALKAKANKTDADFKELGEFSPIIEYLFPESFVESMTADTKLANMGQAIVVVMYAEDVFIKQIAVEYFHNKIDNGELYEDQIKNLDVLQLNPMFIFEDLGFQDVITQYDKMEINWFEIQTNNYWDENSSKPTEFLSLYADVEKPSWMMSEGDLAINSEDFEASLTYPTASGVKSVDLDVEVNNEGVELKYSAWDSCNGSGDCQPDTSKMNITDYVSGDYTISVTYGGETFTKTFKDRIVIKDVQDYKVELTTPKEQPQWPEILNDKNIDWSHLTSAQEQANNDYNTAWTQYMQDGVTVFASNDDGVAKDVIFRWDDSNVLNKIDALNLPDNIVPAYQVGLNLYNPDIDGDGEVSDTERNTCNSNWDQCNIEIYNTWWNNNPIKGNSFKLPILLDETVGEGRYNIKVNLVFLDKNTGNEVGQGGNSWAEFQVGTGTALHGDEAITFTGNISKELTTNTTLPTNLKVALIKEQCEFDDATFEQSCEQGYLATGNVVDNSYSLSTDVNTTRSALGSNNGYIRLIVFNDANGNGKWDDNPTTNIVEQTWNPDANLWFDNWGDFVINVDRWSDTNSTNSHSTYKVKQGEDVNVTGVDFKIWY